MHLNFRQLFFSSGIALSLQILGLLVAYLLQVLLARTMGTKEYGSYEYILGVAALLSQFTCVGLPNAVLRFIPQYEVNKSWSSLKGLIWGSWKIIMANSFVFSVLTALLASQVSPRNGFSLNLVFMSLIICPCLAISKYQSEVAKGMKDLSLAYVPSLIAFPLLIIASICYLNYGNFFKPNHYHVFLITIISLTCVISVQFIIIKNKITKICADVTPKFKIKGWLSVAIPLLVIDGSFIILNQTDIIMLGSVLSLDDVGIYSAALKTASWLGLLVLSVNAVTAPIYSALFVENDINNLQKVAKIAVKLMFWPSLILAILFAKFSFIFLGLFGEEFVVAKNELFILLIANVINAGIGSVVYLLLMTGSQIYCSIVLVFCSFLNVLLNFLLIPVAGRVGAALATAISMIIWNLVLLIIVKKKLKINPSIVG